MAHLYDSIAEPDDTRLADTASKKEYDNELQEVDNAVTENFLFSYSKFEPIKMKEWMTVKLKRGLELPVCSGTWVEFKVPSNDKTVLGRIVEIKRFASDSKGMENMPNVSSIFEGDCRHPKEQEIKAKFLINIFEKIDAGYEGFTRIKYDNYRINTEIFQTKKTQLIDPSYIHDIIYVHKLQDLLNNTTDIFGAKNNYVLRYCKNYNEDQYETIVKDRCLLHPLMYHNKSTISCPYSEIVISKDIVRHKFSLMFFKLDRANQGSFGLSQQRFTISPWFWADFMSFVSHNSRPTTSSRKSKGLSTQYGCYLVACEKENEVESIKFTTDEQFALVRAYLGAFVGVGAQMRRPTYKIPKVTPKVDHTWLYYLKESTVSTTSNTNPNESDQKQCCLEFSFNKTTFMMVIRSVYRRKKYTSQLKRQKWFQKLFTINSDLLRTIEVRNNLRVDIGTYLRSYNNATYMIAKIERGFAFAECQFPPSRRGEMITLSLEEAKEIVRADVAACQNYQRKKMN